MGHRKGRSKAETIEVKIERRCSSKEPATIVSNYEDKLNGDSVPSSRIIGRSVLRRLQIVAKLNIVTHARARAHVAWPIDKRTTAGDEYVYTSKT